MTKRLWIVAATLAVVVITGRVLNSERTWKALLQENTVWLCGIVLRSIYGT